MENDEALDIVKEWGDRHGHKGTLETMIAMKQAAAEENLTARENAAFSVAFYGFRRLFHGGK